MKTIIYIDLSYIILEKNKNNKLQCEIQRVIKLLLNNTCPLHYKSEVTSRLYFV